MDFNSANFQMLQYELYKVIYEMRMCIDKIMNYIIRYTVYNVSYEQSVKKKENKGTHLFISIQIIVQK